MEQAAPGDSSPLSPPGRCWVVLCPPSAVSGGGGCLLLVAAAGGGAVLSAAGGGCLWLVVIVYDIRLYTTAPGINARARVRTETHIKHLPASLRYAGGVLGVPEGGYSREDVKSRGGALKCDCDGLPLFEAGQRGQKKGSASGTNTAGAAFCCRWGLVLPGGVVALDLLPDGAADKAV